MGKVPTIFAVLMIAFASVVTAQAVNYTATGSCIDDVDGDISDRYQWSSDLQGPLGSGAGLTFDLNPGQHVITATCADNAGNVFAPTVMVSVMGQDITPPNGSIEVIPTPDSTAAISVTPTDPIEGNYSMKLTQHTDGKAAYAMKPDSPDGDGTTNPVLDWRDGVDVSVAIRHRDAVIEEGFEMVVVRGAGANDVPLFDLILVGTASEPLAVARVHDAGGPLSYPPVTLTQTTNTYQMIWRQDAVEGRFAFLLNGDQQGVTMYDLNTDTELKSLRVGGPAGTGHLDGHLIFDSVQATPLG